MELHVQNVNEALSDGIYWLLTAGVREESRNGPVIVSPEPVMTIYHNPIERVLFSPTRDANPFFHVMEALWMLGGRNDLRWPLYFNSKFGAFSDNGQTIWGAYGYRWRKWFQYDQLDRIISELRQEPNSRRVVLSMWDGTRSADLFRAFNGGKDVPCNTHVYFQIRHKALEMTVCCRSNDIIWGAYGANSVHFSFLQEYIARYLGIGIGVYRQFSNNYHLYPALYTPKLEELNEQQQNDAIHHALRKLAIDAKESNMYASQDGMVSVGPFVEDAVRWDIELDAFFADPEGEETTFQEPFFEHCAVPMYRSWKARKEKTGSGYAELTDTMQDLYPDWYLACYEWIRRRINREENKPRMICNDCGKSVCTCHRVL